MLTLSRNEIGPISMKYLADAIRNNTVLFMIFHRIFIVICLIFYKQILSILAVKNNRIGDQGTENHANALKINRVIVSLFLLSMCLFCTLHLDTGRNRSDK